MLTMSINVGFFGNWGIEHVIACAMSFRLMARLKGLGQKLVEGQRWLKKL
jgi:hypothetical protein